MTAPIAHDNTLVETRALVRELGGAGATAQTILHGIDLRVPRGQFVALTGASGSGKSTLLYLLGVLDRPTSGQVWLDGVEVGGLSEDDRARFRNEKLGFVFQFHFLLPEFSVLENVMLPMLRRGVAPTRAQDRAMEALEMLGLTDLWRRKPGQISGGQQQRVSIARAFANDPALILADEPTGNLDSTNAQIVFDVFRTMVDQAACTVIMVTHDTDLASAADRQVRLRDGRVIEDHVQRQAPTLPGA
jgi:lipoprotein-releasing system ATP-binding protein